MHWCGTGLRQSKRKPQSICWNGHPPASPSLLSPCAPFCFCRQSVGPTRTTGKGPRRAFEMSQTLVRQIDRHRPINPCPPKQSLDAARRFPAVKVDDHPGAAQQLHLLDRGYTGTSFARVLPPWKEVSSPSTARGVCRAKKIAVDAVTIHRCVLMRVRRFATLSSRKGRGCGRMRTGRGCAKVCGSLLGWRLGVR